MSWTPLRLAARTAGAEYGEQTVRVADLLEKMSPGGTGDMRPAVVWFYDPDQDEANQSLESKVFTDESLALSLRMFRRYRVNVREISDERIREEYGGTPSFHFFDPANAMLFTLAGKKVDSLSTFDAAVEKAWRSSFTTSRKDFARDMTKILDRLDKVEGRKTNLALQKARLAEKPNPRKERELAAEEQELAKAAEAIAKDEKSLFDGVALRAEYRLEKDEVAAK